MEELIDVLNENGIKTGEILTRKEIHKRGLWHRIIVVAIINEENELLMQQRSYKKDKNPGKWDVSVVGHISSGQSSVETAVREIEEELGITISPENLKYILSYKDETILKENYIDRQFYDFYIAKIKEISINDIRLQESEVEDAKFVKKEEFKKILATDEMANREPIYKVLENYLV